MDTPIRHFRAESRCALLAAQYRPTLFRLIRAPYLLYASYASVYVIRCDHLLPDLHHLRNGATDNGKHRFFSPKPPCAVGHFAHRRQVARPLNPRHLGAPLFVDGVLSISVMRRPRVRRSTAGYLSFAAGLRAPLKGSVFQPAPSISPIP